MSVTEYALKLIHLSIYSPEMFPYMRFRMRKFVSGLDKYVKKEFKATLLIFNTDIARIMVYAQHVDEDKQRDREKHQNKIGKSASQDLSQQMSGNGNKSFFQKR